MKKDELRKIEFKEPDPLYKTINLDGETNKNSIKKITQTGLFHAWERYVCEDLSETWYAIVEDEEGIIKKINPIEWKLRFVN